MSGRAFLPPRAFNDHPARNDADRTLVWPDGSIYRITRSSADTGGELPEMERELPADG
jgi:hypothetical protein